MLDESSASRTHAVRYPAAHKLCCGSEQSCWHQPPQPTNIRCATWTGMQPAKKSDRCHVKLPVTFVARQTADSSRIVVPLLPTLMTGSPQRSCSSSTVSSLAPQVQRGAQPEAVRSWDRLRRGTMCTMSEARSAVVLQRPCEGPASRQTFSFHRATLIAACRHITLPPHVKLHVDSNSAQG
jgi:hypothetical protein